MERDQWQQETHLCKSKSSAKVYNSSSYPDKLFRGLNEQRQMDRFCDIVLVTDEVRFPAHRNILAACSSFFNSMFTIGMRETFQKEVDLFGASSIGCKAVLDFMYSNKLSLDSINVDYVLETAHMLQMWMVVDMCSEYLVSTLTELNYLHLQALASFYNLKQLDSTIDCFVLKYFERLSFTPDFIERVPVEKLCLYLDSDQVQLTVEHDLLKVALQWLDHCPERAKEAPHVLENIRYSFIPKSDLGDMYSLLQQSNCQSFIDEALYYHSNVVAQPVLHNRRTTLRADGERLLFLGGAITVMEPVEPHRIPDWDVVKNQDLCFLDMTRGKWMTETQLPDWRLHFGVAVLGNFIFCAGGYTKDKLDSSNMVYRYDPHYNFFNAHEYKQTTSNMVYRYDPRWKQWTKVASMNQSRESFYLGALKDRLVAVGGRWDDNELLASIEIYDPQKDSWSYGAEMPRATFAHAGAVYKDHIYISGGVKYRTSRALKSLLCYNYCKDMWEEKMCMSIVRCLHNMCTLDDRIYAIGGCEFVEEQANECEDILTVESYNTVCDQWTIVAPLLEVARRSGATLWNRQIYILGGEEWEGGKYLRTVQVYDCDKNICSKGTDLPERMARMSACVCVLRPNVDHDKNVKQPFFYGQYYSTVDYL